jgi:hypothetical protein
MPATLIWLEYASRSPIVLVLSVACVLIALAVPFAANRGRLHVPGYIGIALLSFVVALIFGRISGIAGVRGTRSGEALSIVFFLLVALAAGAILAIFFYAEPPQD